MLFKQILRSRFTLPRAQELCLALSTFNFKISKPEFFQNSVGSNPRTSFLLSNKFKDFFCFPYGLVTASALFFSPPLVSRFE